MAIWIYFGFMVSLLLLQIFHLHQGEKLLQRQDALLKANRDGIDEAIRHWEEVQQRTLIAYADLAKLQRSIIEKTTK